jgi:hypothetical protein
MNVTTISHFITAIQKPLMENQIYSI